ncbi:MAG: hypothetical protein ACJ8CR_32475, partial [Roseiflexaceae bacterium]
MAVSLHLPDDLATQSARLRQILKYIQIIGIGLGVFEITVALITSSRLIVFLGAETLGVGLLGLVALLPVSRGQLTRAVSWLCTGFFAVSVGTVFVLPGALPILTILPILAMVIALPYLSSRALRGFSVVAWLVIMLAIVLAQVVTPLEPPTTLAMNVVLIGSAAAIGPMLLLLLWQFHSRLTEALAHALAANASLQTTMAEAQAARAAAEQASELK